MKATINIKEGLRGGKKFATDKMIENNDCIFLINNTVVRTWGGNEQLIGDKYFSYDSQEWYEIRITKTGIKKGL